MLASIHSQRKGETMSKEEMEQIICKWISSLGYTRAVSIKLVDVRKVVQELSRLKEKEKP
jgi:hypothetical protein